MLGTGTNGEEMLESARDDFIAVMKVEPDNTQCLTELRGVEGKLALLQLDSDSDNESPVKTKKQLSVDADADATSSNDNSPSGGFTKLSLEEVEEAKIASPSGKKPAETKTRIAIQEDSDDSSDEEGGDSAKEDKKVLSESAKNDGNTLLGQGKFQEAIGKYDEALALDGSNIAAMNNKCLALVKLESWTDAIKAADAVLAAEPDNTKAITRKASALVGLGKSATEEQLREAIALFERGGDKQNKDKVTAEKLLKAKSTTPVKSKIDIAMEKAEKAKKSISVKVPDSEPKTTSELETAVRSLKGDVSGESVCAYLSTFKTATYKKVFKDSMDPELLEDILVGLGKTWGAADARDRNTKIMNQLAKVAGGLGVVMMVMGDEGKASVKKMIGDVKEDAVTSSFWKKAFKALL
jgi:tetratricopeptide (TPR) repeat protein